MDRFIFNNMIWKKKKAPLEMYLTMAIVAIVSCMGAFAMRNEISGIAVWATVIIFSVVFSLLNTNEELTEVEGVFHFTPDSLDLDYEFKDTGETRSYTIPLADIRAVYDRRRECIDINCADQRNGSENIHICRNAPLDEIVKYFEAYGVIVTVKGNKNMSKKR